MTYHKVTYMTFACLAPITKEKEFKAHILAKEKISEASKLTLANENFFFSLCSAPFLTLPNHVGRNCGT